MESGIIKRYTDHHNTEIIERGGANFITGYGSIFYDGTPGTEYQLGENLYERIAPGCFDRNLAERQNVEIRFNHSSDWVLGDVETGATVQVDSKGLRYSLPYDPNDPQHATVKAKINKGLIRGSSFAAKGAKYRYEEDRSGKHIAWLTGVDELLDCAPVSNPAYKAAPAMMRSEDCDKQYNEWLRMKAETEKRLKRLNK